MVGHMTAKVDGAFPAEQRVTLIAKPGMFVGLIEGGKSVEQIEAAAYLLFEMRRHGIAGLHLEEYDSGHIKPGALDRLILTKGVITMEVDLIPKEDGECHTK